MLLELEYVEKIKRRRPEGLNAFETIKGLNEMKGSLGRAAKIQSDLGLGNPESFVGQTVKAINHVSTDVQVDRLSKMFKRIKQPFSIKKANAKTFKGDVPVFSTRSNTNMVFGVNMLNAPEVVIVKLERGITHVTVRKNNTTVYKAAVPVIPTPVLELARRAKAVSPDLNFYLAYKPEWDEEKLPLHDPILMAHHPKGKVWFEIAKWDFENDLELIEKILKGKSE